MPVCKNCGTRLSKFDTDICPVCGCEKPLEGVNSETIEITANISEVKDEVNYHSLSKKVMLFLGIIFGPFGALYFYLRKPKAGFIYFGFSALIFGLTFVISFFASNKNLSLALILSASVTYLFAIVSSLVHFFKKDLKDGRGEFVR